MSRFSLSKTASIPYEFLRVGDATLFSNRTPPGTLDYRKVLYARSQTLVTRWKFQLSPASYFSVILDGRNQFRHFPISH